MASGTYLDFDGLQYFHTKLKAYIDTSLEDLDSALRPNTIFNLNMGCTSFWRGVSRATMFEQIGKIEKYFSKLKFQIRLTFNETTQEFDLDDNFSDQIDAIAKYIEDGGVFGGLHFYQETRERFQEEIATYGANLIFGKYLDAVNAVLDMIPFKSSVSKIWLFNEAGHQNLNTANKVPIIECIEAVQAQGYLVSIPVAYAEDFREIDQDILDSLDFYSLNCYPTNDYNGENSSIADVARRFDTEFRIIQPFLNGKDLVIPEFGCSSSWYSFNQPSQYREDRNGKPISLMIEGFFQSEFANHVKECYYWYYTDAYRYSPNTLLSVKNNTEVRYNG